MTLFNRLFVQQFRCIGWKFSVSVWVSSGSFLFESSRSGLTWSCWGAVGCIGIFWVGVASGSPCMVVVGVAVVGFLLSASSTLFIYFSMF